MAEVPDLPSPVKSGFLAKRVGGIPLVYILGVGVAVLAFVAYRMNNQNMNAADVVAEDGTDTSTADAEIDLGTNAGGYDGFVANPQPVNTVVGTSEAAVDTNDKWAKRSVEWLAAQGLAGAGSAQYAIQQYLNGEQLSYDQGALRDAAIKQYGLPPDPILVSGRDGIAPGKKQFTAPGVHTVQGPNDDGYTEIINLYWGGYTQERYELLRSANPSLGKSPFPVGTRVAVPAWHAPKYYKTPKGIDTASEIGAKNGISSAQVLLLNSGRKFPVKTGTSVRVA